MTKKRITEEVNIKVPKKLEKDIEMYNSRKGNSKPKSSTLAKTVPNVGLNTSSTRKLKEHIREVRSTAEGLLVKGHCLLDVAETAYYYPATTGSGNSYLYKRIMMHPANLLSRRLAMFASLYNKYKFKRLELEYCTETNATVSGAFVAAFTKDYAPLEPLPGVDTLSWISELANSTEIKVWENKKMTCLPTKGDLNSYYLGRTSGELETVFEAQLILAGVGLSSNTYYGMFYINYEIEFTMPSVPPTALAIQNGYTAKCTGGTVEANQLAWSTDDASQISFWAARQGIYLCTLARDTWTGLAVTQEYSSRNYFGTSFVLSVQGVQHATIVSSWSAVRFAIYPNMSAVMDGNLLETTSDTWNSQDLVIDCSMLMSTDSLRPSATILATKKPVVNPSASDGRLGIGIGVGPGVLAGELDIQPSIGFDAGRLVMGNPYNRNRY